MKKVVLIFPDTASLAAFILDNEISNAEANSREQTLVSVLEEDEIITAVQDYGGHLNVELTSIQPSC